VWCPEEKPKLKFNELNTQGDLQYTWFRLLLIWKKKDKRTLGKVFTTKAKMK
jgi:hypothetical protein